MTGEWPSLNDVCIRCPECGEWISDESLEGCCLDLPPDNPRQKRIDELEALCAREIQECLYLSGQNIEMARGMLNEK